MLFLTVEQHQDVVRRLYQLGTSVEGVTDHPAGLEYTSLMMCFLMHNLSSANALLKLERAVGNQWFPVCVGYVIVRTMFETDVTAHYISQRPVDRARQYIDFGAVLEKQRLDACAKHRTSRDASWREGMALEWQYHWASRESEVNHRFAAVAPQFSRTDRRGKQTMFRNWSGKTIRQMAEEVDHLEAYDRFYAELSSFAHVDVHLADRFLQRRHDGFIWSPRAVESDVANVFRYAACFLTCYLKLFAQQFSTWSEEDVQKCWDV